MAKLIHLNWWLLPIVFIILPMNMLFCDGLVRYQEVGSDQFAK